MTDKEELPTDIVLIKDFPPFTKETSFTLNSETNRYERKLMIPIIDDKFRTLAEIEVDLSFDAVGFKFDIFKYNFLTLEEYENKKFNDYKISELENLLEKLKQL